LDSFLDMRTLIFVSGLTSFILFACMLYIRRKQKTYDGFNYWILAALANGSGMLLLSRHGFWPDILSIVVAGALIIISIIFVNIGLGLFAGVRPYYEFYLLSMFVFAALYFYFIYVEPCLTSRLIVFTFFQALLCIIMLIIVRRDLPRVLQIRNYALYWFLILIVAWPVFRIAASFFAGERLTDLMAAGFSHQLSILVSSAAYIILIIALILINAQRVEQEMLAAQSEIKTITGLIPICAHCKKIRDDEGSWNQLETYLSKHADLEFSHALCPECMQNMYPAKTI